VATRIAILAQDLIWSERLARAVEAAGAEPVPASTAPAFERALDRAEIAIVDLTARAYDPLAALEQARTMGVRVFAVGQHDDLDLRKRALAHGAERVYAYRKLFEDGPGTIGGWLDSPSISRTEEASA
jgi:DNA-binding response OmpR family regulator